MFQVCNDDDLSDRSKHVVSIRTILQSSVRFRNLYFLYERSCMTEACLYSKKQFDNVYINFF